jgi:4-alpha-glucanotransferase
LLHPTSLPGDNGIGDLGPEAYAFVNFLEDAGQTYWQVLPLGPTGYGDSPYQCLSSFAGNTLLISPEMMTEDGLLKASDLDGRPEFPDDRIDFGAVNDWKNRILGIACSNFSGRADQKLVLDFRAFAATNSWWLEDYALYRAIKSARGEKPWFEWPDPLKLREPGALAAIGNQLSGEVMAERILQFVFFRQWGLLREYANKHGIGIIGDIPIFAALDSADVWCNQDKFKLDPDGSPRVVAGVPPDFFSETGQHWGNPIYDWDSMAADGFRWWIARVEFALQMFDLLRIDHFRGFAAAWEIPGADETAENGEWVTAPGKELFSAMQRSLGELPFIAEDLGVITPDVTELRETFGLPGMRIFQYAFGGDAHDQNLPHNYVNNCVAYTGTHDNDTAAGWWSSIAISEDPDAEDEHEVQREYCLKYLNSDGVEINWDMIRVLWGSVADTAIVPMQDVIGLGSDARMNVPATGAGNWSWRMKKGASTNEAAARLKELTDIYGRARG